MSPNTTVFLLNWGDKMKGYNYCMSHSVEVTGAQLANALHMLGINFIMGGSNDSEALHRDPKRMIAALADSKEARLRLSLIPLFLEHPEFSSHVREVVHTLPPRTRLILQCYYSAAVWLQRVHRSKLTTFTGEKQTLPEQFSRDLNLQITDDPETNLFLLAERHRELSGEKVNWLGTYKHAAQIFIKGLEIKSRG